MGWWRRTNSKRPCDRGIAAIEFALSLLVLVPLMLGILDYAYYFYVGINVVEAQQAGLTAAARTAVGDCTLSANAALVTAARSAAQTAESTYLANANLTGTVTLVSSTSAPTCPCAAAVTNTCWDMSLSADFKPIIGWVAPWMKHGTSGNARFTAHKLVVNGQ